MYASPARVQEGFQEDEREGVIWYRRLYRPWTTLQRGETTETGS